MKKLILIFLSMTVLFSMELWEQQHNLNKQIFKKQMSILKDKEFDKNSFEFFDKTAKDLGVKSELKELISTNNIDNFIEIKAKFLVSLENSAFDKKQYDLVEMFDFDNSVEKEVLFGKKIKKLFVKLEKSNLKLTTKPLESLYFIKYYLDALNIKTNNTLINKIEVAIKQHENEIFMIHLKKLQNIIITLKSPAVSQEKLEQHVKAFVRYNKLTAFDFTNGVDDDKNIKNSLEYTEAVIFSARAKEKIMAISGNLSPLTFRVLLDVYEEIIANIQQKQNKSEVANLTRKAKDILLEATNLKEIKETPAQLVANVIGSLKLMEKSINKNDFKGAEFFRLEAYSFFDPDIEGRLIPRDPKLANELEGLFWDGYKDTKGLGYAIANKNDMQVLKASKQLAKRLSIAQEVLETKLSYNGSFIQSAMIIIREGLEAVLVIAILLSLFTSRRSKTYLLLGTLFGIAGSFATYYLAKEIISISTSNRELIEGVSALIASSMLIFVTAWIFHNTYSKGWVEYAKELTQKSMKSGSLWTLLFIGFIVVYREGFETVLFYETLANESHIYMI